MLGSMKATTKLKAAANTITVEQAAKWLAVSNLGGPFTIHSARRYPKLLRNDQGGRAVPVSGEGMDFLYNVEHQSVPELEKALPAERKDFERRLKREPETLRYYTELLEKELGLTIAK